MKNNINRLPDEFGNLINLEILTINYNYITELPHTIKNLTKLYRIDLASNKIMTLQSEIFVLPLYELNLFNNMITDIPPEIYNLGNTLMILLIGNCDSDGITTHYTMNNKDICLNITDYEITENNIKVLPNEFALLRFLVNFYCRELEITHICYDAFMTIFKTDNESIKIPNEIVQILIFCEFGSSKLSLNNTLRNLSNKIQYLTITPASEEIECDNLPSSLETISFYTAPSCNLFKPYSHWPQPISKEDIKSKIRIPLGCKIYLNDDLITL